MAIETVEALKRDAVIKIEVSAACYYVVKDLFMDHLDNVTDQKETLIRLSDSKDLNTNELTMRFLLDFVKACEDSAKENKQVEMREVTVPEVPTEDPSES